MQTHLVVTLGSGCYAALISSFVLADYRPSDVQSFVWLLLVLFEVLLSWLCTKRNTDVRKSLRNFDAWLELQKIYKAANFVSHSHLSQLFGMTKCFIDVNMWPPFLTCCYRVVARLENMPDSQPEELWTETKPSVQHTSKQNYIHFPSYSTLFETPFPTSDWWTLTDKLFAIFQQHQNCLQASEF